jgi:hypothetical protein
MSVAPAGEEPAKSWWGKLIEFSKQIRAVVAIVVGIVCAISGYSFGIIKAKKELEEELGPKITRNENTIVLLKAEAGRIRTYIQLEQGVAEARFRARCDRLHFTYDRNSRICFPLDDKDEANQPERLPWLDEKDPFTIGDEAKPKEVK